MSKHIGSTMANDGHLRIYDCYADGTTVERTQPGPRPLSIAEQMGTDPMSKLAAAINNLADALRESGK